MIFSPYCAGSARIVCEALRLTSWNVRNVVIKRKEKGGQLFSRGRAVRARELALFVLLRENLTVAKVRMPKEILLNVIFTALGGKAKRNRFRELDVLPQFQTIFFNIQEHPFVDVFEGKTKFLKVIIEKCSNEAFRALWVELHVPKHANVICGVVWR